MCHFLQMPFNKIKFFFSKVSRPDKLAVHVFEVDEDVDKDEVSLSPFYFTKTLTVSTKKPIQSTSQSNDLLISAVFMANQSSVLLSCFEAAVFLDYLPYWKLGSQKTSCLQMCLIPSISFAFLVYITVVNSQI